MDRKLIISYRYFYSRIGNCLFQVLQLGIHQSLSPCGEAMYLLHAFDEGGNTVGTISI